MTETKPRIAVVADFDDTLSTSNVAHTLLRRFAPEALQRYSGEYRSRQITFREYQERCFDAVDVSLDEMGEAAAESTVLRDGLAELLSAIAEADASFTVASAGLDFYIQPVLEKHGIGHVHVVCGSASPRADDSRGLRYDYPFDPAVDGPCQGDWTTCKCKALEQASQSSVSVFVGDGSTADACAASKADYVFARDRLLTICRREDIPATPFEDFLPVAEFVRAFNEPA